MNIAVIAHTHHPIKQPYAGGLEMHTHLLCKILAKMGHHVTLFAKGGSVSDGYLVQPIVTEEFSFHPRPAYSYAWSKQEAVIKRAYRRALTDVAAGDFDAIINNSLNAAPWESTFGQPVLTVLHTPVLPLLQRVAGHAVKDVNKVFASVSRHNADSWSEILPEVSVVNNGIDLAGWNPPVAPGSGLRWSGRITAVKGIEDAVTTAQILGQELLIAGPISDVDYFESEVRPYLSSRIQYVGHLHHDQLARFYGSGRTTLMTPKWDEPFGLVAAESLACGTPIAAYGRGGLADLVTESVGSIAKTSTPAALATAVEAAQRCQPQLCRAYARENFSAERMVIEYLALIDSVSRKSRLVEQCIA